MLIFRTDKKGLLKSFIIFSHDENVTIHEESCLQQEEGKD